MAARALLAAAWFSMASARDVRANGRFPATNQLVVDPNDPDHLVLGVTFGLLDSRDGGRSFSWICERVLGLADQEDPVIVLTDLGTTVLATFNGVVVSADNCGFDYDPGLEGEIIPDVTRSAGVPGQVFGFRTIGLPESRFDSELLRSDDGGRSWSRLSPPLADDLLPLTIEVSRSHPERVYLTAREGRTSGYGSVLLRSDDGGETFARFPIPGTENQKLAFIGAVDPNDPDRIYVRIDDTATVLLVSDDGGGSFRSLFTGAGRLLGFAVSPDGNVIATGGPSDGIWMSGAATEMLERRSDVRPSCLRFSGDALYACATLEGSGFVLGRSEDAGRSFEALLRFESLCGPTACGPETAVGTQCPAEWAALAPRLTASCGVEGEGGASDGSAGSGTASEPRKVRGGGCAVHVRSSEPASHSGIAIALLTLAAARRRRSHRSLRAHRLHVRINTGQYGKDRDRRTCDSAQ